jgi:hypothetical protein
MLPISILRDQQTIISDETQLWYINDNNLNGTETIEVLSFAINMISGYIIAGIDVIVTYRQSSRARCKNQ